MAARVLWEDLIPVRVWVPRQNAVVKAFGDAPPKAGRRRVSYSGYYATFPKLRWRFDSAHPLSKAERGSPLQGGPLSKKLRKVKLKRSILE